MKRYLAAAGSAILALALFNTPLHGAEPEHPLLTWVKRHPLKTAKGKPSPRMGYETSYGYDPKTRLLIRYGGHNQGGGGEQNSEVWTYDLDADRWTLMEPNDAPPGVCCAQQNVFDEAARKFIRFPAFSGSHGWQSHREIYLKNSSVWIYDLDSNTWRAMRPSPQIWPRPLRGAAYDPHHQVTLLHGGQTSSYGTVVYDLYTNTWYRMNPKPAPTSNISQPGFTYDAVHRVFVLFGSQFGTDPRTWLYDPRKNQWRVLQTAQHPPAEKTSPVLAADTRNGIVLASVDGPNGHETWVLDVAKAEWRKLQLDVEPDRSGARNRVLIYLPDRNLFVLENRVKREQQIWTFRYADAPAPPPRPEALRVETGPGEALLRWQPPRGQQPRGYNIYRGQGEKPWEVQFEKIAENVTNTRYKDTHLEPGTIYFYRVRAVDAEGAEGPPSLFARTQPPVVLDVVASVLDPKRIEIRWSPPPGVTDIAGYYVERADVSVYSTDQVLRIKKRYRPTSDLAVARIRHIGPYKRLTDKPIQRTWFIDETVDLKAGQHEPKGPRTGGSDLKPDQLDPAGKPYRYAVYAYRVYAVNRLGAVSGPSPIVFSYPSAVQYVFSKEQSKTKARLKWKKNREKNIVGYLVYRHEGRWNTNLIERLTPKPIQQTEWTDEQVGKRTRRYEIVAVDVLGQEGEPSRPVWFRREWRRFYIPYVGEWHQ